MTSDQNIIDIKKIESIIEGLLFAAGERVTLEKIAKVLDIEKSTTKTIIRNMMYHYNNSSRGIMIREINNGYQLCTKPEVYDFIKLAFEPKQKQGISQAAYETLAIIAYNGPVTKLKIEQLRGVNSDSAVAKLMERNLIKETGRLDSPGKPLTFDVSEEFFRQFGFNSKADLPVLEMSEVLEDM
jgi:segregation and condensation protein B